MLGRGGRFKRLRLDPDAAAARDSSVDSRATSDDRGDRLPHRRRIDDEPFLEATALALRLASRDDHVSLW